MRFSARGGCIEFQIVRGQMDTSVDELAVGCRATVGKKKKKKRNIQERDPGNLPMSVRADLIPHPGNLYSATAASFSRILVDSTISNYLSEKN